MRKIQYGSTNLKKQAGSLTASDPDCREFVVSPACIRKNGQSKNQWLSLDPPKNWSCRKCAPMKSGGTDDSGESKSRSDKKQKLWSQKPAGRCKIWDRWGQTRRLVRIIREWETPGPQSWGNLTLSQLNSMNTTLGSSEDDSSQQCQGRALQSKHSPAPHQINVSPH